MKNNKIDEGELEIQFTDSVSSMLEFCLNDAYLLDVSEKNKGLFKQDMVSIAKIYMDKSKSNMKYLDDVKKSYDSSFELAKGLKLAEWKKFFNGEKCDILDYVFENVPKLFLRWQDKLSAFVYNFYATNVLGNGYYACVYGTDKAPKGCICIYQDYEIRKILESYQEKHPEYFYDSSTSYKIWTKWPKNCKKSSIDPKYKQLLYFKDDIDEVYHELRMDTPIQKINLEFDAEIDRNEDDIKLINNYEEYDEKTASYYLAMDMIAEVEKLYKSFLCLKTEDDLYKTGKLIGKYFSFITICLQNSNIQNTDKKIEKLIDPLKEAVEEQLKKYKEDASEQSKDNKEDGGEQSE